MVLAQAMPMVRTEEAHPRFLLGEDMLDAGADLRLHVVGASRRIRHGPALGLLAMDSADEAVLVEEGFVCGRTIGYVGPDALGGVAAIEQTFAQPRAFIGGGIGDKPASDQAMLTVDRDMVLVAESGDGDVAGGSVPSACGFALMNLTGQRASRSFCRSLAGRSFQAWGMRSALIASFSSLVLRCRGVATRLESTNCPGMAM